MTNTFNTAELMAVAEVYFEDGANIVPVYISEVADSKTGVYQKNLNLVKWGKWISQRQTQEEFDDLPWQSCNGFAVILGYQDSNGYFFAVADFDPKCSQVKSVYDEQIYQGNVQRYELEVKQYQLKLEQHNAAVNKGRQLLVDFPVTRVESTINGGKHYLFKSKKSVVTDKSVHVACKVEVLTERQLCIMAPSLGYQLIEANPIAEIDDFNQFFQTLCTKHDLQTPQQNTNGPSASVKNIQSSVQRLQQPQQLTDEKIVQIVQILLPLWVEGKRQTLTEYLCGWFIKQHIQKESAQKIVGQLCNATNTSEVDATEYLKNIRYQYSNRADKPDLKGWTGILEIYVDVIGQPMPKEIQTKLSKIITKTANQGIKKLQEGQEQKSPSERIVELFLESNAELFHDQTRTEYAKIPIGPDGTNDINDINDIFQTLPPSPTSYDFEQIGSVENVITQKEVENNQGDKSCENIVNAVSIVGGFEIVRLKDSAFKEYLSHLFYVNDHKIPSPDAVNQAVSLLCYYAKHGKCYTLYNRVAPDPFGNGFWLDMADKQNRAYHITKEGWTLETNVPILFKRYPHQKTLSIAVKNGDPKALLPFVNVGVNKHSVSTKYKELLLLVQTVSYGIAEIAHPINAMFGCPGTHKSSAQRFIREVFDPSAVPYLSIPKNEQDALQVLDHHYIPIFDNIAELPRWFSETLCKAVTGMGQECRALYTNDESFIRAFRRCVMLNGLNLPAQKGDLLNRTILHPTEPTIERRTEQDLNTEFAKVLPEILGGFLDAIVKALNLKETLKPPKLYRLADFTEWGYVLAEALGYKADDFIKAMDENLKEQNTADIENNIVADAFLAYLTEDLTNLLHTEENPMKMSPEELFKAVTTKAEAKGVTIKSKKWPSVPNVFMRKLNESKTGIIAHGWNYEVVHGGKKREMHIWHMGGEGLGLSRVEDEKLCYHYKQIPPTEPCKQCENAAVEYILKTPNGRVERLCQGCFERRRNTLVDALFIPLCEATA